MTLIQLWKLWRLKPSEEDRLIIASAVDNLPPERWSVRAQMFADIVRGITQ